MYVYMCIYIYRALPPSAGPAADLAAGGSIVIAIVIVTVIYCCCIVVLLLSMDLYCYDCY